MNFIGDKLLELKFTQEKAITALNGMWPPIDLDLNTWPLRRLGIVFVTLKYANFLAEFFAQITFFYEMFLFLLLNIFYIFKTAILVKKMS